MAIMIINVLVGFILSILILGTVMSNLLLCVAVFKNSKLHRTENAFLISLAVSDLLMALLVMTFAGVNDLLGYWIFGPKLCDCWIAVDILCSTASIFNLCVISLDRYLYIKRPLRYSSLVTKKVVIASVVAIWVVSFIVSVFPVTLGLHRTSTEDSSSSEFQPFRCAKDISPPYAVVSAVFSFYLPCCIMVSIYSRLFNYSRRQCRVLSEFCPCIPPNKTHKHHKAAITIGFIMGTFLVCWVPFFSATIVAAICKTCISDLAFRVFSWLGYCNSILSPIVYTALSSEFKSIFKKIWWRKLSSDVRYGHC